MGDLAGGDLVKVDDALLVHNACVATVHVSDALLKEAPRHLDLEVRLESL